MSTTKKQRAVAAAGTEAAEPRLGKAQIAASERYRSRRDLVDALLKDGEMYTIAAVDSMIQNYGKGQVK